MAEPELQLNKSVLFQQAWNCARHHDAAKPEDLDFRLLDLKTRPAKSDQFLTLLAAQKPRLGIKRFKTVREDPRMVSSIPEFTDTEGTKGDHFTVDRFDFDSNKYQADHPLAQFNQSLLEQLIPEQKPGYELSIQSGNDFWQSPKFEGRRGLGIGLSDAAVSAPLIAPTYAVGNAVGTIVAVNYGAGVTGAAIAGVATGAVVVLVVCAGTYYAIKFVDGKLDDSGTDLRFIKTMDEKTGKEEVRGLILDKKSDGWPENRGESTVYMLNEDGMLIEVKGQEERRELYIGSDIDHINGLLDVSTEEAFRTIEKNIGSSDDGSAILVEVDMTGEKSKTFTREIPKIPGAVDFPIKNLTAIVTDTEGNEVDAKTAKDVLHSVYYGSTDPVTGKRDYRINPIPQILLAIKMSKLAETIDNPEDAANLSKLLANQLYTIKNRSYIAADDRIDVSTAADQGYAKLADHIRVIYRDLNIKARKEAAKTNDDYMKLSHLQILSEAIRDTRVYSETEPDIYGDAFAALDLAPLKLKYQGTNIEDSSAYQQSLALGAAIPPRAQANLSSWLQSQSSDFWRSFPQGNDDRPDTEFNIYPEQVEYLHQRLGEVREAKLRDAYQEIYNQRNDKVDKNLASKLFIELLKDLRYVKPSDMDSDTLISPEELEQIISADKAKRENLESAFFGKWVQVIHCLRDDNAEILELNGAPISTNFDSSKFEDLMINYMGAFTSGTLVDDRNQELLSKLLDYVTVEKAQIYLKDQSGNEQPVEVPGDRRALEIFAAKNPASVNGKAADPFINWLYEQEFTGNAEKRKWTEGFWAIDTSGVAASDYEKTVKEQLHVRLIECFSALETKVDKSPFNFGIYQMVRAN